MSLSAWSYSCSAGFTLRGWRSEPSGKPVLHFLHGNGFCGRAYSPMLHRLGNDFDLWLCDAQGHGDSDHGGAFVGWNQSAALALEAWQAHAHDYEKVPHYACGHSFGGVQTCLIMAEQPGIFERAVLLDPILFTPSMIALMTVSHWLHLRLRDELARKTLKRRSHWPDRASAFDGLKGRGIFKDWSNEALKAYVDNALTEDDEGVRLKCRPSREAEVFRDFPRKLWSSMRQLRTPTHILYGSHTYPFVAKSVARACALNGCISAQTLPGGHCFMQEDPDLAARQTRRLLLKRD